MRNASQHGRAVGDAALFLCGWMLLLTTLSDDTWSVEELLWLYRARWQVELLFKRMKQLLQLRRIRSSSCAGAEATIRALLVAWLLQEATNRELHTLLAGLYPAPWASDTLAMTSEVVSRWTVTVVSLETLRQQVGGQWSEARVRDCLPQLRRFLVSRSRRPHQETEVRALLTGQSHYRQLVH
jgi:hypothetical protein